MLAGGRSRRFGSDKLVTLVGNRPAIARVVARVEPLASDLRISTSTQARRRVLEKLVPSRVSFLVDQPGKWGRGPAAAMAGALETVGLEPSLFVPGDMPWLETRALQRLVARAGDSEANVAVPYWPSGATEHLVQWHRSSASLEHLPESDRGSPPDRRASEFLRAVPRTLLVPVAGLSSRPRSFSHLTYPSDRKRPPLRGTIKSSSPTVVVEGLPKRQYTEAHAHLRAGRHDEAARCFLRESRWYATAGLGRLAEHALKDAMDAVPRAPAGRSSIRR